MTIVFSSPTTKITDSMRARVDTGIKRLAEKFTLQSARITLTQEHKKFSVAINYTQTDGVSVNSSEESDSFGNAFNMAHTKARLQLSRIRNKANTLNKQTAKKVIAAKDCASTVVGEHDDLIEDDFEGAYAEEKHL